MLKDKENILQKKKKMMGNKEDQILLDKKKMLQDNENILR